MLDKMCRSTGLGGSIGQLEIYVALLMIKRCKTVKLIRCVNDGSNCTQAYLKICWIFRVISNNADKYI